MNIQESEAAGRAWLPLEHFQRLPRNVKEHDLGAIIVSIQTFGFVEPVIINRLSGHIIGGHGRVDALQSMKASGVTMPVGIRTDQGSWEVPVFWIEIPIHLEEPLSIALNKTTELGGWNDELLATVLSDVAARGDVPLETTGFSREDLDELLARIAWDNREDKAGAKETDAKEAEQKWPVALGDLYEIGAHRLVCGDCTDPDTVKRLLDGAVPNLCITDPPYGVEYDPAWRDEAKSKKAAFHKPVEKGIVHNDERVDWKAAIDLFPGNVIYMWHGGLHGHEVGGTLIAAGFEIRSQIVWTKQHFVFSRGAYHWRHEPCYYAVRKGENASWIGDRAQDTVWEIQNSNPMGGTDRKEKTVHATEKPIECMARPIRNHSGDVYEPFAGSGTTLVAADMFSRRCFAAEIDPRYCSIILERMAKIGYADKIKKL